MAAADIVDLFCGAGGLSLGAHLSGFRVALAIDNDPVLTSSFAVNFPEVPLLLGDVSKIDLSDLASTLGKQRLAGIIGGPPCQGFSEIGARAKDEDPRRKLLHDFFRVVSKLKPFFFIMENVRGLGYPVHQDVLNRALGLIDGKYDILGPLLLDASHFEAPTRRRRLFVIGVDRAHLDTPKMQAKSQPVVTVRHAISDLVTAGTLGLDEDGIDWWRYGSSDYPSDYARASRSPPPAGLGKAFQSGRFSGHRRTQHSKQVADRFSAMGAGDSDPVGKHRRLDWDGLCPALRAGTGPDHGRFQSVRPIHPSEPRVITVREAARLQGFPDWFKFHSTIWHSFRMIGNSVSPPLARSILDDFARQLGLRARISKDIRTAERNG